MKLDAAWHEWSSVALAVMMVCLPSLHSVGIVTIFIPFCGYSMPFPVFGLFGVTL